MERRVSPTSTRLAPGISAEDAARDHLLAHMGQIRTAPSSFTASTIGSSYSGVDVIAMHETREGADLLQAVGASVSSNGLGAQPVRVDLVTNAHPGSIAA